MIFNISAHSSSENSWNREEQQAATRAGKTLCCEKLQGTTDFVGKKRQSGQIQCRRISIRRCCCKSEGSAFNRDLAKPSVWKLCTFNMWGRHTCWQQRWSIIGINSETWKQVHTFMYVVCCQKPSSDKNADNCAKYNLLQRKDHVVWMNQPESFLNSTKIGC